MGLNETLHAGWQGASAMGSELLGKPVEIALRSVQRGGWELASGLKGFTLACPVSFGQELSGGSVVLMDVRTAALMGELFLGNATLAEPPKALGEAQKGAAVEALSQIVGALGEGLSRASRRRILASVGELAPLDGDGAAAARGAVREERVVVADLEIKIGAFSPSRLVHVLSGAQGDILAVEKAGGVGMPDLVMGPAQTAPGGSRVHAVQFGTVPAGTGEGAAPSNLELLLDVPLEITVELGRATRRVRDVLGLGPGSIVELNKLAGEPVDVLVNGKTIAKGEVVVIDENFAVRIIEILSRDERLAGGV